MKIPGMLVFLFGLILVVFIGAASFEWLAHATPPPAVAASGTVERRLHLKLESRMDTDHPRTFVCREER